MTKNEKLTFLLGTAITVIATTLVFFYLDFHRQIEYQRKPNSFFEALESADLRYNDIKYRFLDQKKSEAPVALIAIDDDSIREIGRWPWSRDLMAELTEKLMGYGAKSVAFDIIFSEPEKASPENDARLAEVLSKYKDKIILGTFSENISHHKPYQDYCVAEAFLKAGGNDLVKLNPTFVVEDTTTNLFEELPWSDLFSPLFLQVQAYEKQNLLQYYKKNSIDQLTQFQKNYLSARENKALFEYCHEWLEPQDRFFTAGSRQELQNHYKKILSTQAHLAQLSLEEFTKKLISDSLTHPIPQYAEWTPNIPLFQQAADYSASFIAKLDSDGYVRHYPLFYRSGNKLGSSFIPSLALQSYLLAKSYRAYVKIEKAKNQNSKSITQFSIIDPSTEPETKITDLPIDNAGQLLINYYGPQMSLPYVPAKELFSERDTLRVLRGVPQKSSTQQKVISSELVDKKAFLEGKNLVVGLTAEALYDLRNTPTEPNYPGPEIHLTVLANLLDRTFLKTVSNEIVWLPASIFIFALLLSFLFSRMASLQSFALVNLCLVVSIVVDFWLFIHQQIKTSGIYLSLVIAVIYSAITIFRFFTEEKTKKELRTTFSKYVSPAVVDELLKEPDNLKLGGRRQRMTVFFSDLRGFTTISEKLPPEDLVKLLNRYLSPMTEIVFANSGTLDKYMGDAIMAFFGAPISSPSHAAQACRCALQSLDKLKELQKIFASEGLPFIDIGIGINTGEMSVGNMGSNIVQSYTVMGDAVNLASRLEGTNKEYGCKIIISEFTYQEVKDQFIAREIDRVRVKGKNEPVRIYELVQEGPANEAVKTKMKNFSQAFDLYLAKKFPEALEIFKQITVQFGADPVSEVYIERCSEYITEPPPANWDGVYVMKTK